MKKFFQENWKYILVGVGVLVLFSIRFYNLTILPVFADEAIYIRWSQVMKAEETLRFLPLSDGKQPLFMWVVIPFLKFIQDPLFAGRFVSVLSGLGTLIGVFTASLLLFKTKKIALIASTIYALSPYSVFFDRLALSDSMLSMFGVWTFVFAYLTVTTMRFDFAMLAGFALGGAWLTKSPALFFALLLPSLWLFAKSYKAVPRQMFLSLVTVFIGYGMYSILRLGPNFHQIAIRNLDYVYPYSHILTSFLDPLKPYADRILEYYRMMGPWPILVVLLLSYFVNWRENWKKILVLSAWFLGPIFAVSEFSKTMTARYAFFTVPFVIILASSLFLTKSRLLSKIGIGLLIIFILTSAKFDYLLLNSPEYANLPRSERSGFLEEWTAGQGIKEVSNYIKVQLIINPSKKIVVGTEGYFGTLPDGLQIYLQDRPQVTAIGVGLNFTELPKSLVESQKAGNDTYLVVNRSRFNASQNKFGLELIAAYPKAIRPEGIKESNIFGPQDVLLFYKLTSKSIEFSKTKE